MPPNPMELLKQLLPPKKIPLTIGYFETPEDLYDAAEAVMEEGFEGVDAISPYPIHGLEHVLKIPDSWIPYATLGAGLFGCSFMLWFEWWSSAVSYPLNVGGKPLFSWPAFMPIFFEGGELLAGTTTLAVLLLTAYVCRPHGIIKNKIDPRLTNDRFALLIPNNKPEDEKRAHEFLKGHGADDIRQLPV